MRTWGAWEVRELIVCLQRRDDDNYDSGASVDESVDSDDDSFVGRNSSESEDGDDGEEDGWRGGEDEEDENKKALCMYAAMSIESARARWEASVMLMMVPRHCDADEEHDPASDFEEALECSVCGAFGRFPRRRLAVGWVGGVDK